MKVTKHNYLWRFLFMSLLVGTTMLLNSCGDDEPKSMTIDYYINVEEEFLVNGSVDHTDRYLNPLARMKEAIRSAYPTPNTKGNDDAVIAACDKEYENYNGLYEGVMDEHLTCLYHLVRVKKEGDIIRQSETLRTYVYDINPIVPED